jgi:hypothetical protein
MSTNSGEIHHNNYVNFGEFMGGCAVAHNHSSGLSLAGGPIREANASAAWLVGRRDCNRYDIALGDAAIGTVRHDLNRHGVAGVDARWNLGVHLE